MSDSDRYGAATSPARRRLQLVLAGVVVAAAIGWIAWASFGRPDARIGVTTIGYKIVSDGEVTVTYDVSRPPGTRVTCVLRALNSGAETVGSLRVDLPAADATTTRRTDTVRTTGRAVTGVVRDCTHAG